MMLMRFGEKITQEVAKEDEEEYTWHNRTVWYAKRENSKFEEEVHLMANLQHKWVDVFNFFTITWFGRFATSSSFIHFISCYSFKSNTKAHLERKWKIVKSLTHFSSTSHFYTFGFFSSFLSFAHAQQQYSNGDA